MSETKTITNTVFIFQPIKLFHSPPYPGGLPGLRGHLRNEGRVVHRGDPERPVDLEAGRPSVARGEDVRQTLPAGPNSTATFGGW